MPCFASGREMSLVFAMGDSWLALKTHNTPAEGKSWLRASEILRILR